MRVTICSSISFIDEINKTAEKLRSQGHEVQVPKSAEFVYQTKEWWDTLWKQKPDEFVRLRSQRVVDHFDKVRWADAILVTNFEKNDTPGYIGANTLMEMGLAFYLGKPIYLLHPIPEYAAKEEIVSINPIVINEDLTRVV